MHIAVDSKLKLVQIFNIIILDYFAIAAAISWEVYLDAFAKQQSLVTRRLCSVNEATDLDLLILGARWDRLLQSSSAV